jgi:hypothetical protein
MDMNSTRHVAETRRLLAELETIAPGEFEITHSGTEIVFRAEPRITVRPSGVSGLKPLATVRAHVPLELTAYLSPRRTRMTVALDDVGSPRRIAAKAHRIAALLKEARAQHNQDKAKQTRENRRARAAAETSLEYLRGPWVAEQISDALAERVISMPNGIRVTLRFSEAGFTEVVDVAVPTGLAVSLEGAAALLAALCALGTTPTPATTTTEGSAT